MQNPQTLNLAAYVSISYYFMSRHFVRRFSIPLEVHCDPNAPIIMFMIVYFLRSKYNRYLSPMYFTTRKSPLKWLSSDSDLPPKSYSNNIKTKQTKKKNNSRESPTTHNLLHFDPHKFD